MGFSNTMSTTSSGSSVSGRRRNHGWAPSTCSTALTPTSLLKKYPLPIAAYLHTPETPPGLDTSRPLLLYSNYTSTKVRAVSLRFSRDGGALCPAGPSLVIPDSYTGWFSVISSDGRSASYYSTVEQVAAARLPFFLTRFDIPAYVRIVDQNDCGRSTYHRTVVQSGHVLKLLGIFEDLNARKNAGSARQNKESPSLTPSSKYIQCLNYCNEEVFVPFSASGRFYATAHRGTRSSSHVFLMSQLINTFQLPVTVRLVCGYMPRVPQAFTGILRLEKSQKESVILASTMTPEARATLLEMDVSSNFILSPVTDPIFSKTPIFLKTVSFCSDEADSWRRQIKVTHHVTEDSSGSSLGRSSSDKTFESNSSSSKGFSFFKDLEKRRVRVRERSKTRDLFIKDKSRDIRLKDKNKESQVLVRGRAQSRETSIKNRVMDKLQDMSSSSNNQCVVSGEFISIRVDDKLKPGKKGSDNRKISKQNTYIFQNERTTKYLENKGGAPSSCEEQLPRSFENQEYSTVLDDISAIKEVYEPETSGEETYTEICEVKTISDARSGIVRARNRDTGRHWRTHLTDERTFSSISSTDEENNYSFTLLKKDMSKCYAKLPGLIVTDAVKSRVK